MSRLSHSEIHMVHRIGWLRAAVLGANDGLVSTASLVVGVAAAGSGKPEVLIAGLAGLVAGAMSMAAGEYVSVSSQTDAENADLARETRELAETPEAELEELTQIYVERGLDRDLAEKVAVQLTERDALGSHARDELGISETVTARLGVGADLRRGCGAALDRRTGRPGCTDRFLGRRVDDPRPRGSWWIRRFCWRCWCYSRCCKGHALGCTRHGGDRWSRCAVRGRRRLGSSRGLGRKLPRWRGLPPCADPRMWQSLWRRHSAFSSAR